MARPSGPSPTLNETLTRGEKSVRLVAFLIRITVIVCGPLPAPVPSIVTEPMYVPMPTFLGSTETLTLPGVVPLAGVARSQAALVDAA